MAADGRKWKLISLSLPWAAILQQIRALSAFDPTSCRRDVPNRLLSRCREGRWCLCLPFCLGACGAGADLLSVLPCSRLGTAVLWWLRAGGRLSSSTMLSRSLSSALKGGENRMKKRLWVEIRTRRWLASYCPYAESVLTVRSRSLQISSSDPVNMHFAIVFGNWRAVSYIH